MQSLSQHSQDHRIAPITSRCAKAGGTGLRRLLVTFLSGLACASSMAASNVVEYVYDAAGNVKEIRRSTTSGLAVTGFEPISGPEGTSVTIYGAGFSPVAANNVVQFNGTNAQVSAAGPGSLAVMVPIGATTGRISVAVGAASTTSSVDFTVVAADAPVINNFTPSSGTSGTSITVAGSSFAAEATVVKLNGVPASATVASPTELIMVVPDAASSGRITATTSAGTGASLDDFIVPPPGVSASDIATTMRLNAGASPASLALTSENKHALLLVDGEAEGYYTLQFSSFISSPSGAFVDYKVYRPDNSLLSTGRVGNTYRPTIHLPRLSMAGTYSVLISPGTATLSAGVQFMEDALLVPDGEAVSFAANALGQTTRMRFQAVPGQRLGLGIIGLAVSPSSSSTTSFKVYGPSGSLLSTTATCAPPTAANPQGNCDGEFVGTQSGTHTLLAETPSSLQVSFAAQISTPAAGALDIDVRRTFALGRVGQDLRSTFEGTAGDSIAVELTGIASLPHNQAFQVRAYRPDGALLASTSSATSTASAFLNLPSLVTGEYAIEVDPVAGAYGEFGIVPKSGPPLIGTEPPSPFATTLPGERARFRFAATAGQNLGIGLEALAHSPATTSNSTLRAYKPDGTELTYQTCSTAGAFGGLCKLTLGNLPSTGTYSVTVVGPGTVLVSGALSLSADLEGALVPDVPIVVAATRSGQNGRFAFAGSAGDRVGIELVSLVTDPAGGTVTLQPYKPDGSLLLSGPSFNASTRSFVLLPALPTSGTYRVLASNFYGAKWEGRIALRPAVPAAVGGAAIPAATTDPGQVVHAMVDGTSGQRLELGASQMAMSAEASSYEIRLHRANGAVVGSAACGLASGCELSVNSLPATETYSLLVVPPGNSAITSGSLHASLPATGSITVGDPALPISIDRPGQTARYAFGGTSGQLLRLDCSNTVISGASSISVSILKPDGLVLSSGSCLAAASGGFDVASLPTTGNYTLVIDPPVAATASGDFSLSIR